MIHDLEKALELLAETAPSPTFNSWYSERYVNNLMAQVYWFKAESPAKETADYQNESGLNP